jgi:hypothetical protein
MIERIFTYADPITTAIIIFAVVFLSRKLWNLLNRKWFKGEATLKDRATRRLRELMDAQRKTSKRAAEKRWVSDTAGIDKNLAKQARKFAALSEDKFEEMVWAAFVAISVGGFIILLGCETCNQCAISTASPAAKKRCGGSSGSIATC